VNVGPAVTSTGGAVSNTGQALHRLGFRPRLLGKVGDDLLSRVILEILRRQDASLTQDMIVASGEASSYTVVISPPGVDRVFLHCPGANDTFKADDVDDGQLVGARLFHFGYPPLMRRMYTHGGNECARLLRRVKKLGITTSLDMAMPDPDLDAGRVDWKTWLKHVLPHVDVFLPSVEEILFMVDRKRFDRMLQGDVAERVDGDLLTRLAGHLLRLGAALVVLKLGDQGVYLRTTTDAARLSSMGRCRPATPDAWRAREILAPCFRVKVVGTTGSGDCTIAGFLGGLLKRLSPEDAVTAAVAVGGFNVEQADATSGVPGWAEVEKRVRSGWKRRPVDMKLPGWTWNSKRSLWIGPHDAGG
jgi:sugar/nucleoside kinase (ribokinase family)